jgi:hypothetical protein
MHMHTPIHMHTHTHIHTPIHTDTHQHTHREREGGKRQAGDISRGTRRPSEKREIGEEDQERHARTRAHRDTHEDRGQGEADTEGGTSPAEHRDTDRSTHKEGEGEREATPASMRLPKYFQPVGTSKKGSCRAVATRSRAPLVGMERATPCVTRCTASRSAVIFYQSCTI